MNCDKTNTTFLIGNNDDYVLFKLAIDSANQGLSVWFISVKPFEEVPKEIEQPCKEVLQLITFIYLNDYIDLLQHLNGIHKWKHIPNVLILNNFDNYCNLHEINYDSRRTTHLVASLLDSASFLSRKKDCNALLLVACSKSMDKEEVFKDRLKILCDMYFDNFLLQDELQSDKLIRKIKQSSPKSESTTP